MWLVIMEAVGLVSKTAKGFFGDSGVSIDNWTFKFFYKVMYYFAKFVFEVRIFRASRFLCHRSYVVCIANWLAVFFALFFVLNACALSMNNVNMQRYFNHVMKWKQWKFLFYLGFSCSCDILLCHRYLEAIFWSSHIVRSGSCKFPKTFYLYPF